MRYCIIHKNQYTPS